MADVQDIPVEHHPFEPYIPDGAKIIMLGTFPPKRDRWSMEFYYPNWINDMWRIMGEIFYNNPQHFVDGDKKQFLLPEIKQFLNQTGIALYDTGSSVRRLKDNASDKFLEIVDKVDLEGILRVNATIKAVVTTGEKAASVVAELTGSPLPKMGQYVEVEFCNRVVRHYRMPSSSRAYPMNLKEKSRFYATMFAGNDIHL
ncbi:MAG: uracil-DNA glycosylase family protein [Muribaculaceae bacterium]